MTAVPTSTDPKSVASGLGESHTLLLAAADRPDGGLGLGVIAAEPGLLVSAGHGEFTVARASLEDPDLDGLEPGAAIGLLSLGPKTGAAIRLGGRVAGRDGASLSIRVVERADEPAPALGTPVGRGSGETAAIPGSDTTAALNAWGQDLVLRADTLVLAGRSPAERGLGPAGPVVHARAVVPGSLLPAHETRILIPVVRDDAFLRAVSDLAGRATITLLIADSRSGEALTIQGDAQMLRRAEHAARFPGADHALAVTIAAVRRRPPWPLMRSGAAARGDPAGRNWSTVPAIRTARAKTLLSVNVSPPRRIEHQGREVWTGIFKEPLARRVRLGRLNLDGDGQADRLAHGGAFKSAYVYTVEYYDFWAELIGRGDLGWGQFGENLTVQGMTDDLVHLGDVYRIGSAVVEVSQPRVPCFKLAIRMGIDGFQTIFMRANRVGFYVRTLEEGELGAGDGIELLRRVAGSPTVADVMRVLYVDRDDQEGALKAFAAPALSDGWKEALEQRLERVGALA